jgi:hypothetical protein
MTAAKKLAMSLHEDIMGVGALAEVASSRVRASPRPLVVEPAVAGAAWWWWW